MKGNEISEYWSRLVLALSARIFANNCSKVTTKCLCGHGRRCHGPDKPRQPERMHDSRTRGARYRADERKVEDHHEATADRRSTQAQTRHFASASAASTGGPRSLLTRGCRRQSTTSTVFFALMVPAPLPDDLRAHRRIGMPTPVNAYLNEQLLDEVDAAVRTFVKWLEIFGETSYDHQSYYAGPIGGAAKALYYRRPRLGLVAVAPMVLSEALLPSARRFFWHKQRFPIADAHYAMGFALLARHTGEDLPYRKAVAFLDVLERTRCPEFQSYCWGYPFDWVTRNGVMRRQHAAHHDDTVLLRSILGGTRAGWRRALARRHAVRSRACVHRHQGPSPFRG